MPEVMSAEEILRRLNEKERVCDFPRASERTFWEHLPEDKKSALLKLAETAQTSEIPCLKAKDYMKYFREGNRIDFETPYFRRRHQLTDLVLGECVEYKGRFLDDVAEMLWQIVSEPVWCLPAHQHLTEALPGPEEWVVDLFAAETAKVLTDVLQLLGPELEKEYCALVRRIRFEVTRRVLEVCEKEIFWWYEGKNNWSVWCCYSVNSAAIEVWQDDKERLAAFLAKYMIPMKSFTDRYPEDGGCNEGPCYWVVAVGMLMNGIDVLQRRLGGMESWLEDPKIRRMVEFIPRMNLSGKWFMGFSDAESCFLKLPRGCFAKYGRMVNCPQMIAAAVALPEPDQKDFRFGNRNTGSIFDTIADLTEDLSSSVPRVYNAVDFWPDLQIWIARQFPENPENGMVCCLKGGHNKQSHNHMDLGHFSLFNKNCPVIIDVGRGIYSRTCFSGQRYTLWNLNATGHNGARFDDMPQGLGLEYAVKLDCQGDTLVCDLTGAFMPENKVSSYIRKIEFDRTDGAAELMEEARFEGEKEICISFYTPVEPGEIGTNSLLLNDIKLSCEGIDLASVVKVDWADQKINSVWGDLWQINLSCRRENYAAWKIKFTQI
ncbi:MAG: hypothetical protein IJV93_10105 [Lentisphaeria bacterium]|nr:hypothetical protein [Lentisphaeria bacterium]